MKSRFEIESIRRGKKKLRLTVILSSAFLAVLAATIAFALIIGNIAPENAVTVPPEIKDGEALYRGSAVAYPAVDSSSIFRVSVNVGKKNDTSGGNEEFINEFTFVKDELSGGDFLFSYKENGEVKVFYPSICNATGIEYSDLYAIETEDGYNAITRVNYLLNGINVAYFSNRIELSDKEDERAAQLKSYGFTDDEQTVVVFDYNDTESGTEKTHKLIIGSPTVTGGGYYFRG